MGTIAKGEITLSPVNDAYTVLLTPSSCSISADFDGSNPNLTNAKGTITVKRGTKIVPFKIDKVSYSDSGIKISWVQQEVTVMPFIVTHIPNTILDGYVKFHIITQDGFNYSTEVQFAFNIVRESTMLDWIQDWEGSKTKVSGTYIMTPKLFVGKKEAILDMTNPEPTWKEGALTGVYIGPDLLTSGESSVGIYGYLKDKKIFHINADGGFIGGWTFNEEGLQSFNGIVNILSEGSIYAQNPDSEIPYWGIYANGTASFANGNVRFFANGDAEFIGKIISASGTIGGWNITKNQLHNKKIILDSLKGVIGICSNVLQSGDNDTGDLEFPDTPDGGVKLWYNSAMDFGMAGWTTGEKVFQLGSTNFIAGWNFNHQAIWTGGDTPSLTQGGYTSDLDAITIAPNGIRSNKWYVDANGTASFVGGSVKFNKESGEMFGWLMRSGRFSSQHAALISDPSNGGVYISITDITEVSVGSLRTTIENNGGIYLYSDSTNAIMRAYDKSGKIGFSLNTSGYNTISSWSFDSTAIYIGSKELTSDNFSAKNGSMVLMASGIFGYKWKLLADGSGALAGGKINWDKDGNITIDAKISANNITAGTISTVSIKCEGKWALNQDGSGYLASKHLYWGNDGILTVEGKVIATSGTIGGFEIGNGRIGSVATPQGGGGSLAIYNDFLRVGGSKGHVIFGDDVIPSSVGSAFTAVGRIVNSAPNINGNYGFDQANYGLLIDVTGGTKNYGIKSNAALLAPSMVSTSATFLTFDNSGGYSIDFSQNNLILLYSPQDTQMYLPGESSIASKFGYSSVLPDDFVTLITIMLRPNSKYVIIKGVYDGTGNSKDYPIATSRYVYQDCTSQMAGGVRLGIRLIAPCCITLMISKKDGFRYTLVNYECSVERP